MRRDLEEVRRVVLDTLSHDFENVRIMDVDVADDVDEDGDAVLRINVVFLGQPKDLDARKLSGAVRSLRPKLGEIEEFAFPLLSFISQKELEGSGKVDAAIKRAMTPMKTMTPLQILANYCAVLDGHSGEDLLLVYFDNAHDIIERLAENGWTVVKVKEQI